MRSIVGVMDAGDSMSGGAFERSRERRRGVRQACVDLEEALARPANQDPKAWCVDAGSGLRDLEDAFARHAEQSEGPDGLLGEMVEAAPRLANAVKQIKDEHQQILAQAHRLGEAIDRAADGSGVQPVRESALDLLHSIALHRQRGADLIYEAYSVDIEGSD